MINTVIDAYLDIIKAEMIIECIETIDRTFIKERNQTLVVTI